jgi:hypothetical protein
MLISFFFFFSIYFFLHSSTHLYFTFGLTFGARSPDDYIQIISWPQGSSGKKSAVRYSLIYHVSSFQILRPAPRVQLLLWLGLLWAEPVHQCHPPGLLFASSRGHEVYRWCSHSALRTF